MKKRILHVIPTLERSGTASQVGLLARGLPADEFDVHLCVLRQGGALPWDLHEAGIPVTVIGQRLAIDPRTFLRLCQHVNRIRPHLIHAWRFAADAYVPAAGLACRVKRMVVSLRCVDQRSGWARPALDHLLAWWTVRIVVNSPATRDFCVASGLPAEKLAVIPNGVDPAKPTHITRRQLLAELGLPDGSRLIGLVGSLRPQKRIKDAIWAADLLKVIRDDVHLLILGDGPHADRLRQFRDQVEIRDKVHFLGQRADAPRLLPHFDLLWSTNAQEGHSSAILEAMAAGVPVVATDIPGTRDLVVPERTGYLVPVGDRAGLAACSNRLLNNPELAKSLGEAGRRRMLEEFSAEKMVARYAELYRSVLG